MFRSVNIRKLSLAYKGTTTLRNIRTSSNNFFPLACASSSSLYNIQEIKNNSSSKINVSTNKLRIVNMIIKIIYYICYNNCVVTIFILIYVIIVFYNY